MVNDASDFDQVSKEILKSIRSAEQGKLLGDSLLRCSCSIAKELLDRSDLDIDEMVRMELTQRFSQSMVQRAQKYIQTKESCGFKDHSLELLVFPIEDFKHLVEHCVREIPEDKIKEIKGLAKAEDHLPGFIDQFGDGPLGELDPKEWDALQFLRWLSLNNYKITK